MGGYFQQISDDYLPDRILEAEKICDKHEMEQFPNEGDDLQVLIVDNGKQLSLMIFLEIILKFSNHNYIRFVQFENSQNITQLQWVTCMAGGYQNLTIKFSDNMFERDDVLT